MSYFYTVGLETSFNGSWSPAAANATSVKLAKDSNARWTVRVYKDVEDTAHQLNYASGSAAIDTTKVTVGSGGTVISWVNSPAVKTIGIDYPGSVGRREKFEIEVKASTIPGTFKPSITVVRYADNGLDNGGTIELPVPLKTGKVLQSISYTTSKNVQPSFPTTYTNETKPDYGNQTQLYIDTLPQGGAKAPNLTFDPLSGTDGAWIYAKQTQVSGGYKVTVSTYSRDGHRLSQTNNVDKTKNGVNWKAAQALLLKGVQDTVNASDNLSIDPAMPTAANSDISANPPNHIWTRRPSLDELMTQNDSNFYVPDPATAAQVLKTNSAAYSSVTATHPLGYIIQDVSTAQNLNIKTGKGKNQVYQFNFTYNPTTISYTTSANTPIDWTLGNTTDPANVLGGPTIVTFDLYLNRIQDLSLLKRGYKAGAYPGKGLSDVDQKGLLNRGTEYDLEWLYRVVNGTPNKTGLLTYGGETSDYGYITGTPFWLQFHDNMRYYGGLAGLSVNHVMFTKDMIPTLSVVSLTINRYPVFDQSSAKSTGWILQKEKEYLKSTTTTPGGQ
jgi:hypothetical protein